MATGHRPQATGERAGCTSFSCPLNHDLPGVLLVCFYPGAAAWTGPVRSTEIGSDPLQPHLIMTREAFGIPVPRPRLPTAFFEHGKGDQNDGQQRNREARVLRTVQALRRPRPSGGSNPCRQCKKSPITSSSLGMSI